MSRKILLSLVAATFVLNACSMLDPFVDRRREAGAATVEKLYVGKSTPENPAICYNSLAAPFSEVQKLADEECRKQGTGTSAVPVKQTVFTCRLLLPNHFYFQCVQ